MTSSRYDSTGLKLLEEIAPLRDHVSAMVRESQRIAGEAGRSASASSPAMEELTCSADYVGEWSDDPFQLSSSLAGLCVTAAEDHLDALVTLYSPTSDGETFDGPVYAHATIARAVVETSARAYWLVAPGASYLERVTRAIAELLYTRWERSKVTDEPEGFQDFRDRVERECERRGLELRCREPRRTLKIGDMRRPGNQAAVRALFEGKPEGFSDRLYSFYSAIAHGVAWGLMESLDTETQTAQTGQPSSLQVANLVPLVRSSRSMFVALAVAADAYKIACDARFARMGWDSDRWTTQGSELIALVVNV